MNTEVRQFVAVLEMLVGAPLTAVALAFPQLASTDAHHGSLASVCATAGALLFIFGLLEHLAPTGRKADNNEAAF